MSNRTAWIEPFYDLHCQHRLQFLAAALWVACLFVLTLLQPDWPVVGDLLREGAFFTIVGAPLFVGTFVGFELAAARNRRDRAVTRGG